jgi:hypothetical protein
MDWNELCHLTDFSGHIGNSITGSFHFVEEWQNHNKSAQIWSASKSRGTAHPQTNPEECMALCSLYM